MQQEPDYLSDYEVFLKGEIEYDRMCLQKVHAFLIDMDAGCCEGINADLALLGAGKLLSTIKDDGFADRYDGWQAFSRARRAIMDEEFDLVKVFQDLDAAEEALADNENFLLEGGFSPSRLKADAETDYRMGLLVADSFSHGVLP